MMGVNFVMVFVTVVFLWMMTVSKGGKYDVNTPTVVAMML